MGVFSGVAWRFKFSKNGEIRGRNPNMEYPEARGVSVAILNA
jgi:hypothetical protein